jgi:hypothetical protein
MEITGLKECIYKPFTPYVPPSGLITFSTLVDARTVRESRNQISLSPGIAPRSLSPVGSAGLIGFNSLGRIVYGSRSPRRPKSLWRPIGSRSLRILVGSRSVGEAKTRTRVCPSRPLTLIRKRPATL